METVKKLMDLSGRVALVTGGAGHLGRAMADALAELGASIAIIDRAEEDCRSTVEWLKARHPVAVLPFAVDLEDEAAVITLPCRVAEALGSLDILVNCAAFVGTSGLEGWNEPFESQSVDTWRRAIEVNLTAVFALTQAAAPLLKSKGHGSIINISSIYGVHGPDLSLYQGTEMNNPAAYAASKGGLLQFTRWCATVLAPQIRVNAITPGGVFRNQDEKFVERYVEKTPLKRMACEEDFKGVISFLASDLSAYVTGQNIAVDGGWGVW